MLKLKKPTLGTVIFYVIYFTLVIAAIIGIFSLLQPLEDWLTKYQASQPEEKCQEVFEAHFTEPDWAAIYDYAQVEDTAYEGREAYAAYMEHLVGDTPLTYSETSAGLSGNHKYIVRCDGKKVATFTLTPTEADDSGITHWQLGEMAVFFNREESITVQKLPEHTLYINGTALDDSFVIRSVETMAEQYLPEDIHGYRMQTLQLSGLLVQPEVTVKDAEGNPVEMALNDQGILSPVLLESAPITEDEEDFLIAAAKTGALHAFRAVGSSELRKYFDRESETYKNMVSTHSYLAGHFIGHSFANKNTKLTQFTRYSDGSFSANVYLDLRIKRDEKYTKSYPSNLTYFVTKQEDGKLLVTQTTNIDATQVVEKVRIRFLQDGCVVDSLMVDTQSKSIQLPSITAPEGKVFKGWASQTEGEDGKITMTIIFTPTENGTVFLSEETVLEPMDLYAVFE